jgi:hypothetical protein
MSLQEKQQQIDAIKSAIKKGDEIDIEGQFDDLVDYLSDRGYEIVKREFPPTEEKRTKGYAEDLFGRDDVRTAAEIEEWMKSVCRSQKLEPDDVFEFMGQAVIGRAVKSGDPKDYAEAIEYIKAGYSLIKQTQDDG